MLGVAYPGQIYPAGVPSLGGVRQIELVLGSLGGQTAETRLPGVITHELYGTEEATPVAPTRPPHHEFY